MKGAQSHVLVRLSLRRPVTMMMMLLSMLVLGGIALVRIPLELIPSGFSPPFLRIAAEYPDATAKDVEERITRPLEDAVATTPGIDQISATSTSGSSSITIVFKNDVDMDIAYRQVRDRITRVRSDLPDEVDTVEIRKESAEAIPVAFYSVAWDADLPDPQGVIEQALIRPLQRIEGVGLVNVWGEEKKEVRIEIDRGLAEAHGLDMVTIAQTLGTSNFTMASGTLEEDEGQYMLRSVASWEAPEDIAELIVGPNGVRLRDIGTVAFDFPKRTRYDRYRGRPSLVLFVIKESTANTVDVSDKIKAVVEQAQTDPLLQLSLIHI